MLLSIIEIYGSMKNTTLATFIFTVLAVCMLIASPLLAVSSEASSVECNGAMISVFDENIEVNAGSSTTFNIYIANNNTTDNIAMNPLSGSSTETIYLSFDKTDISVDPGKADYIVVTVEAAKYAHEDQYPMEIRIVVMDLTTGVPESCTIYISVGVESNYSSNDYYNKILGLFENPLPAPFNSLAATGLITFALWIIIALITSTLVLGFILRVFFKDNQEERKEIRQQVGKLFFLCFMIYGVINCLHVVGVSEYYVAVLVDISEILYIVTGAMITWRIYNSVIKYLLRSMGAKTDIIDDFIEGIDESLLPLFRMIGKMVIAVITVASILAVLGFNLYAIIAGAGIAGLALSLGAQNTLNQFFSGLTLLVTRPFKAGDRIRLGTDTNVLEVRRVGIMCSEFKNWANSETFTMPNSNVVNSTIINMTGKTTAYRIDLLFDIAYSSDIELVKKLLLEAANEHPNVVRDGSFDEPTTRLMSFKDASISMRLSVYVNDFENNGVIAGKLRESVFKKFKENGIEIPYPQFDLHIKDQPSQ